MFSSRWLPESDERWRLVGDKKQASRLEGIEPRKPVHRFRECYATICP